MKQSVVLLALSTCCRISVAFALWHVEHSCVLPVRLEPLMSQKRPLEHPNAEVKVGRKRTGRRIVFATYQSSSVLAQAVREAGPD